jgi:transposase
MLDSWFSIQCQKTKTKIGKKNYQKIYSQISQPLLQKAIELEQIEKEKNLKQKKKKELKTKMIRLFPTNEQKEILIKWFGDYRLVYNTALSLMNKKKEKITIKELHKYLRNNCVHDSNYKHLEKKLDLPTDSRDYAIKELLRNRKTCLKSKKKFTLTNKKSKKSQSIYIRRRQFNTKSGFYTFLRQIKINELLPEITTDIKIHMDLHKNFYLLIPMKLNMSEIQAPEKIISIDPGIRTFLTGYSTDGIIYNFGNQDVERLQKLNYRKNRLQGKIQRIKNNRSKTRFTIRRMEQAKIRISHDIENLVDDAHKKIAKWLFVNFKYIVIPKLETNKLCRKKGTSKKVKNMIRLWRHCAFIDRLKFKIKEYPGRKLIIPTEEFTSKTCSNCGFVKQDLGRDKTYNCNNCKAVFDRDINGAKNILLKTVDEVSFKTEIL